MSYSKELLRILESVGAKEGSRLSVMTEGGTYVGTMMPHHDFSAPDIIVLKMKSGYNIGIRIDGRSRIEVLEEPVSKIYKEKEVEPKKGLPNLVLLGTGGTIASYVDYRTGAVHPALSTSDMVNAVPEIRDIANIRAKVLFSIFSENMDVHHWQELAEAVAKEINDGADGVIIPHGTDTMGYTAAALSFMLGDITKPVVLVGAQRSSDRPSSDASSNLMACARFCTQANRAGVFVVMHDTPGDDSFAVHTGSRVRKMHTSRRDAFRSMNVVPIAHIDDKGKITINTEGRAVTNDRATAKTDMEKAVILLQYYPGMDPELFEDVVTKSRGVVISGSGLGHVNENMIPLIKKAVAKGTIVVMTSQCLNGQTNMNVYNTGRDLLKAGVISVFDMLPETAYVKLMWVLANSEDRDEAERLMRTPLAGEMSQRRTIDV
ncbi:MAG: Glu-tRNA(Gln) amidotransferase subunit GatD [Candidatus Methanomethylophilaceae archaeon]